jgi:hypothetical protein
MEPGLEKELQDIISDLECSKDFSCYKQGLENLCKAKDVGLKEHLQCLEENPSDCPFSQSFASINFCYCPLRVHIAKKLGK